MQSSSEVRAVRVRNPVGSDMRVSQWHVIVPGMGRGWPGAACDTSLSGSLQWETWTGVQVREGGMHEACFELAREWIMGLATDPGPVPDQPDRFH